MGDWSKEAMSGLEWTDFLMPVLSGLCLGFENIMFLSSLTWADASKAVGIESTYPLFVIIWSFFFLNERIAPLAYLGIALSLIGSAVLSFDILKSVYSNITAKYPRFKKRHEHFVLVEKEKHEKMAEEAAKKSNNKYYGRFWYPFIKQVDECRMKNYKGDLHELVAKSSVNSLYYDAENADPSLITHDAYEDSSSSNSNNNNNNDNSSSSNGKDKEDDEGSGDSNENEIGGEKKETRAAYDPYLAPDLVYKEDEDEDDFYDSDDDEYFDNDDGTDSAVEEEEEEMGNFSTDSVLLGKKRRRRRNNNKNDKKKKKKPWLLDLLIRNRRVITGLLPIPVIMSGNDFFAKVSVGNMPVNNVSAINSVAFGTVLICTLFTRKARSHFFDEFKYNILFVVLIEALSIFTNYLMILGMNGLSASLVSSLSSTRPLFILVFEKLLGLSKDSVQQIVGFKLLPIIVIICGAILMTLSA